MKWTSDNIPDQSGRVALITGANSGIGFQTAMMLAKKQAEVVLACRNMDEGKQAMQKINLHCTGAKTSLVKLDLADLHSIAECAQHVQDTFPQLDLLINNAGVMVPPLTRTKQGYELQFGTNHLGHFALTGRLLPLIINTWGSRVVSVSSIGARIGKIHFDDLNYDRRSYSAWFAYGQSKLAELLFIQELAGRLHQNGLETIAVAAHPGGSPTNLQRNSGFFMRKILTPLIAQKPVNAALPSLRAACDPNVANGSFWGPSGCFGLTGSPEKAVMPKRALDPDVAGKLWDVSERLTGVTFHFQKG